MDTGKQYDLELSDETVRKLEDFAQKTGSTEEEICEFIFLEFLAKQAGIIEKKAEETGRPANELFNMQFARVLDFLFSKGSI